MCSAPASLTNLSSHDPRRVIGLFLARLLAYLVRLHAAGEAVVPKDIAAMAISAETLVTQFIRMRAAARLKACGFTFAVNAMRAPDIPVGARLPAARTERDQNCEPVTPAELIGRLQTIIETFERAEDMASLLARVIVCALAYIFPETHEPSRYASLEVEAIFSPADFDGQVITPWPPPARGQLEFPAAAWPRPFHQIPTIPSRGGARLCGGKRTSAFRSFPRRRESGICLLNEIPACAGMSVEGLLFLIRSQLSVRLPRRATCCVIGFHVLHHGPQVLQNAELFGQKRVKVDRSDHGLPDKQGFTGRLGC